MRKVALVIGLMAVGVAVCMAVSLQWAAKSKPHPAAATPEEAISRAQQYLLANFDSITPPVRLVADYLHRKFNLDQKFSGQNSPIDTTNEEKGVEYELMAIRRIAFQDSLISDLGPNPTLLARGANCDRIPLPSNISSIMQQDIDRGDYHLTHVAFSMQFMRELGCTVDGVDVLWRQAINGMLKMAGDENTIPDLRYECLAFLQYMGYRDDIKTEWIDQIVLNQHADGGWVSEQSDTASNDHATLLALWALLEYTNPGAPDEPMIHQPANN